MLCVHALWQLARARLLPLLCALWLLPAMAAETPASGIRLSPQALQALKEGGSAGRQFDPNVSYGLKLHTANGRTEGRQEFRPGSYQGSFKRLTNPYNRAASYWVMDEGVYTSRAGTRYQGRFFYFHENQGDRGYLQEDRDTPLDGHYFFAGERIAQDGRRQSGLYFGGVPDTLAADLTVADESYLKQFEQRYQDQVVGFKRQQNADGGLSFGQVLALGLGAAALGQGDIAGADRVEIGGAFVADVLSGGQSKGLDAVVQQRQQSQQSQQSQLNQPGQGGGASPLKSDTVQIQCPSGTTGSIPISYRTESCRQAMISFAKVYSCNLIDDFQSVSAACEQACGHPQCLQQ